MTNEQSNPAGKTQDAMQDSAQKTTSGDPGAAERASTSREGGREDAVLRDANSTLGDEIDALLDEAIADTPADGGVGEDVELIQRARSDPEAFGILYEKYVDRVYAYIYHRVGNQQDAEDLTARTFHRALGSIHNYEERGLPFAAWLFRIAHNLVANWHRDRSRRRFLSLDRIWSHRTEGDDPERELEKKEVHDALWDAINQLPDERRDLLIYKFGIRLSNLEIGETMNKSESAVKSLYFRTLAALRKELEGRGWGMPFEEGGYDGTVPASRQEDAQD